MLLGYARVSTEEQNAEMQLAALKKIGCDRVFLDQGVSGAEISRPALGEVLKNMRAGDQIVVWRLDRLSRSLSDLLQLVKKIEAYGGSFRSLNEQIDTSSPAGTLMFHMLGALAEFERALISERTKAGMRAAKANGASLGRPARLTAVDVVLAQQLARDGTAPEQIAKQFGVSRATIYRAISSGTAAQNDNLRPNSRYLE